MACGGPPAQHRAMRLPSFACLLAVLAAVPAANAGSALGSVRASAGLDFRIVVPAMVRVQARAEPPSIALTAADIARGYVEIDEASAVTLTSNSSSGFALTVSFDTALVRAVEVRLGGATLRATQAGVSFPVYAGRLAASTMRIGYRILLAPGARPGSYRWPMALTYSPWPA
jgi:hypothetical protein